MPRYFIHIGMHETVTEFLQQSYLPKIEDVTVINNHLKYESLRAEYIKDNIIISNEELSGIPWNKLWKDGIMNPQTWLSDYETAIINIQKLYPEAEIIIVFRKHGDLALSLYKKYIKNGGVLSFDMFYAQDSILKPQDLSFERRLDILNKHFNKVHVLDFEKFKTYGEGYFYVFFNSIGLKPNAFINSKHSINESISGKKLDLWRKSNMIFFKLPRLFKKLCQASKFTPRHIFDNKLKHWETNETEELTELKNNINFDFLKDWGIVSKSSFSLSEIDKKDIELRAICSYDRKGKEEYTDYYGIGYWYKKYAGFPQNLTIRLYTDHAPSLQETLLPFDIRSPYKNALFHNTLKIEDNKEKKRFKKVYIAGSAFVHYRKIKNIQKSETPKGTLCLPMHPTTVADVIMDYDAYMDKLLELPDNYHPFTICLYYLDIQKGLHQKFLNRGFDVVTAGHLYDDQFPVRFYDFLKDKKYVTSNAYGSFIPYAIEMGIPFFFHGHMDEIKINNRGDDGAKMGVSTLEEFTHIGRKVSYNQKVKQLFKKPLDAPTKEQVDFADFILGVNHQISAKRLKIVFWKEFLLYELWQLKSKWLR